MKITFIVFVVIAILLTKLPVVGRYFYIVNTLIHEIGHALIAIVTGGSVSKIELFANTEGTAWTSHRSWLGRVLTSIAGYPFASFIAFLFLYFLSNEQYNYILYILIAMLVISFIFWIRNLYGFIWIVTFSAGFGGLLWIGNETLTQYVLLFITAIVLVQSVISALEILILSFRSPKEAGDATNLSQSTFIIPAQLWGIFFFLQALYFAWQGISVYFGPQ